MGKKKEVEYMWFMGVYMPVSDVPDIHPLIGTPVGKPTSTKEERWVQSLRFKGKRR
jgi:hypothetical protein